MPTEFLHFIWWYAGIVMLLTILVWLYRYRWQPWQEKKRLTRLLSSASALQQYLSATTLLDKLYQDVNTFHSAHRARARAGVNGNDEFTYGEILPLSLFQLLMAVDISPEDIFYDLGCGAGKTIFFTALAFNIRKACGVELLPYLYQLASSKCQQLTTLLQTDPASGKMSAIQPSPVQFIHGNLLDRDISDATLVFINATCFHPATWQAIQSKLQTLPAGARIILTSKKITVPGFRLLFARRYLMSWGMCTVNAYQKSDDRGFETSRFL